MARILKSLRSSSARSTAALRNLADEELMQMVRGGHAAAFEVIYDRHADAAFSLAYRICGQRALAEDVVQEGLLALWRSGARYDRDRGSVRTWILGIVHNRAVDALRRREVREALEQLPDEQSRVIELAYFGGLTHVEIASLLETPVGTVKGRMRLGLAKMRMTLGEPSETVG
jgi:RNA polymerase sigma-70 factor (ECF subfamily)